MRKAYLITASVLLVLVLSCKTDKEGAEVNQTSFIDLNGIRERGKIVAVTEFNSTNYFVYKGQPMGFHYELLKSFSDFSGINVEIVPENDPGRSIEMLNSGEADILATDMAVRPEAGLHLRHTDPLIRTRFVLVQRKPNRWTEMSVAELDRALVRKSSDLAGRTVYVQKGSSAAESLRVINSLMGDSIAVIEVPYEKEILLKHVAKREIGYAVCEENIALVNNGYYPVLDVSTDLTPEEGFSWGLRKESSDNLEELVNSWISSIKNTSFYALLYAKYFRNSWSEYIVKSDYYTLSTGKVSPFDEKIKSFSDSINWDWRLLASLIYQESRFKPFVTSPVGAYGLMQVMPSTARKHGIDIKSSPENNIKAGVMHIKYLQAFFSGIISDEDERLKFVIGAYNAGEGNILDAMRLAEKHGKDPYKWDDNVEYYLLKKTDPVYYNDPVVQFGYCRGDESVNFVAEILTRYSEYKNIIP